MPKSPLRRKTVYTPPAGGRAPVRVGSPRWLVPLMLTFFLLGLAWIVVYYLSETRFPVEALGPWNMGVGFGLVLVGFALATRWR